MGFVSGSRHPPTHAILRQHLAMPCKWHRTEQMVVFSTFHVTREFRGERRRSVGCQCHGSTWFRSRRGLPLQTRVGAVGVNQDGSGSGGGFR